MVLGWLRELHFERSDEPNRTGWKLRKDRTWQFVGQCVPAEPPGLSSLGVPEYFARFGRGFSLRENAPVAVWQSNGLSAVGRLARSASIRLLSLVQPSLPEPNVMKTPSPKSGAQRAATGTQLDPRAPSGVASRGTRIAGILLIVNVVLVLLERSLFPDNAPPFGSSYSVILPSIFDVFIGVSLARGLNKYRTWAVARVALGALVFMVIWATQGNWLAVLIQLAVSAAILGLLLGNPAKSRVVASCTLFALYAVSGLVGIGAAVTGSNIAAPAVAQVSGGLEKEPAGQVHGRQVDYRLTAPGKQWFLLNDEAAKKGNPLADHWLVRPDVGAHVMIIAERLADNVTSSMNTEIALGIVLEQAESRNKHFKVIEQGKLVGHPNGDFAQATGEIEGLKAGYFYAVFVAGAFAYQVTCWVSAERYDAAIADFRAIAASFAPAPSTPGNDELAAARTPEPEEPQMTPSGEIHGRQFDYQIKAPNKLWFPLTAVAAKKQDPVADHWLARPDAFAHVTIVAEEMAEGVTVDPDGLLSFVMEDLKTSVEQFRVVQQGELAGRPNGRFVRATGGVGKGEHTYFYAVLADDRFAYRVECSAASDHYESVRADFDAIVASFRPAASR